LTKNEELLGSFLTSPLWGTGNSAFQLKLAVSRTLRLTGIMGGGDVVYWDNIGLVSARVCCVTDTLKHSGFTQQSFMELMVSWVSWAGLWSEHTLD
jgi:hypothetical protein